MLKTTNNPLATSGKIYLLFLIGSLQSCVSNGKIGHFIRQIDEGRAEFSFKENYIKSDDRVALFIKECNKKTYHKRRCWTSRVGEGKVIASKGTKATVQIYGDLKITKYLRARRAVLMD